MKLVPVCWKPTVNETNFTFAELLNSLLTLQKTLQANEKTSQALRHYLAVAEEFLQRKTTCYSLLLLLKLPASCSSLVLYSFLTIILLSFQSTLFSKWRCVDWKKICTKGANLSRAAGNGGNAFLDPDWLTETMASSDCLIGNVTKTYHENDGKLKADKFFVFFYMELHGNRFVLK